MKTSLALLCAVLATSAFAAPAPRANPDLDPIKIVDSLPHTFSDTLLLPYPNGGQARVLVTIAADGSLSEWLVIAYTARPFAEEAVHAIKNWRYRPAHWRGDPIAATTELTLTFESKGSLVTLITPIDQVGLTKSWGGLVFAYRPHTLKELDVVPQLSHSVSPSYPRVVAERGTAGEVLVDFYIDEQGAVRMPSIVTYQHPDLASAAVAAIRQWKFSPALANGRPVLVNAQQVFRFDPSVAALR